MAFRVGTFVSANHEDQLVTLLVGFSDADAVGVSIEKKGIISPSPEGAIVMLSPLSD